MATRGRDSAGLAAYTDEVEEEDARKFSLYAPEGGLDWRAFTDGMRDHLDREVTFEANGNHAVVVPHGLAEAAWRWVVEEHPEASVLSVGRSIEVYKDTGHPADIAERYGFRDLVGSHVVAHTRMATESAATWAHAHPYHGGEDFCLIHTALSNPNNLRRMLSGGACTRHGQRYGGSGALPGWRCARATIWRRP